MGGAVVARVPHDGAGSHQHDDGGPGQRTGGDHSTSRGSSRPQAPWDYGPRGLTKQGEDFWQSEEGHTIVAQTFPGCRLEASHQLTSQKRKSPRGRSDDVGSKPTRCFANPGLVGLPTAATPCGALAVRRGPSTCHSGPLRTNT